MALSHLDEQGKAVMVDVSSKPRVLRSARAAGRILMAAETLGLLRGNLLKKGDALAVARVAGIAAAKRTSALLPLMDRSDGDHARVEGFRTLP